MSKITLTVSLKQFKTEDIIKELWERVYDNLNDEEPQFDSGLIALPHYEKDSLRQALQEAMNSRFDEYGNYGENNPPVFEKGYPSYEAVNNE